MKLHELTPFGVQNFYTTLQEDGARLDGEEGGLSSLVTLGSQLRCRTL
ncbi:MAG: hypothetical protein ACOY9Y_07605 [Bacillota bacterium]